MKRIWLLKALFFFFTLTLSMMQAYAGTINQYGGAYAGWPADGDWVVITSLNDPDDGVNEELDFVGDASDPGAYIAVDTDYVYIRLRVDVGTIVLNTTYEDSVFVFIDLVGSGTAPDYAVAWDTKGAVKVEHGMEFQVDDIIGTSWSTTRMDDIDASVGSKIAPPDFRTAAGDGYIRTIDSISTTNFGTTSFIDFAISWDYLDANSILDPGQTWMLQFGSINAATDHNFITTDVAGGTNPATPGLDWSNEILLNNPPVENNGGSTVPEPHMAAAGACIALAAELFKRLRKKYKFAYCGVSNTKL